MILVTILLLREIIWIVNIISKETVVPCMMNIIMMIIKLIIMRIMINEATLPKEAMGPCWLEIRRR